MIDAENEARYEAWFDSCDPFDFTGDGYLPEYEGCSAARSHTDWTRQAEELIAGSYAGMVEGRSAMILDRADLAFGADFDEACFEDPDHLPDAYEGMFETGLSVDVLAAIRLLSERDPTFMPRLRKLGATPELVREANNTLGGHEFAREAKQRIRPAPAPIVATRRTCTRARSSRGAAPGRRQGTRRVAGGSRAGPSDDPGESEPPGLRLWRHPKWGATSPDLLRILLREGHS